MTDLAQRIEPYEKEILEIYFVLFAAGVAAFFFFVRRRMAETARNWSGIILRVSCRPWSWIDLSAIVTAIAGLSFGYVLLARQKFSAEDFAPIAISMALTHGTVLLCVFVIAAVKRVRLRSLFGGGSHRFFRDIGTGAIGYVSMVVIVCPAMIATGLLLKLLHREPEPQQILALFAIQKSVFAKIYFSVWTVLIAPVAEEMLFRGILLPLILRVVSPAFAIGAVSLCFAALHGDATAFLPLVAVSVSLCIAFLATESLVVSITMHAFFNSVTTAVLLLAS